MVDDSVDLLEQRHDVGFVGEVAFKGMVLSAQRSHRLGKAALRHIDANQQIAAPGELRQHGAADAACGTCDDDDAGIAHVPAPLTVQSLDARRRK